MLTIINDEHATELYKIQWLPDGVAMYLTEEYESLGASMHHDNSHPFSLELHGYRMIVLQPSDDLGCCLLNGFSNLSLLETIVEYVELVHLPNGIAMYRSCFMPDNECYILLYAIQGTLDQKLERWFSEHVGGNAGRQNNE